MLTCIFVDPQIFTRLHFPEERPDRREADAHTRKSDRSPQYCLLDSDSLFGCALLDLLRFVDLHYCL